MSIRTALSRTFAAALFAFAVSACSTTPPPAPPAPTLDELLTQASQAASGGNKEQAVKLWQETAVAYPADKTPWSHIAQTRYEAGQYGDAIQAALEVLVRDPNDKLANSIVAISGLRLSTRALGDLSRQNNLSGSIRTESQELAKLLRESLGETVLVPAPTQVEPPARTTTRARKSAKKPAKAANANPFQSLN